MLVHFKIDLCTFINIDVDKRVCDVTDAALNQSLLFIHSLIHSNNNHDQAMIMWNNVVFKTLPVWN